MNVLTAPNLSTRGSVLERNGLVSVVDPGWVGSRWRGEEVGGNTNNLEVVVLVTGAYRSEELLDVIYCIEWEPSEANLKSSKAGYISRSWL